MIFAQPGSIDSSFIAGSGAVDGVQAVAIQNDGKIIIGGTFNTYNGFGLGRIVRINTNGILDLSFSCNNNSIIAVSAAAIQSDGKIIIGGILSKYIARLNTDGTMDTTFNPGTGANNRIRTVSIQNDGKIIIGGDFTSFNGTAQNYIARINSNGTLDNTFNSGTGANNNIWTSEIQSDGKIIIGGQFNLYNGTTRKSVARLNTNGTLDSIFNLGVGANAIVYSTSIQTDGKIIIGGQFTQYNGSSVVRIGRLNTNGTFDASFNTGTGCNYSVNAVRALSDGKVIASGNFITFNGSAVSKIVRINANGTIDNTFNPGTGPSNIIRAITPQSDGKIIVGGEFVSYNGTSINSIARLQNDLTTNLINHDQTNTPEKLFPNPTNGMLTLQCDNINEAVVKVYNSTGQLILQQQNIGGNNIILDLNNQVDGLFIVELIQKSNSKRFKISKQ